MIRSLVVARLVGASWVASIVALTGCRESAPALDGELVFRQRCGVCHGQSAEGGQGPSLRGVTGRKAGSDPRFGYTHALRDAQVVWDASQLDQFLAAPRDVVPGTNMVLATPDAAERKAIIGFLATLPAPAVDAAPAAPATTAPAPAAASVVPAATPGLHTGRDALSDYRSDAPGVRRRITVADLPKPFATDSARNSAKVVEPPAGAAPKLPAGFRATVFAKDLNHPRLLRVAPNGDVFVAASDAGQVLVLRARPGAELADQVATFASGLDDPFGIAFYPPGKSPQWVYVAESNVVRRYAYSNGDLAPKGTGEIVVPRLSLATGGHTMRNLEFSPDGQRMYVAVGSQSNVAEDIPMRTADEIAAFGSSHGLGAMWGYEEDRADVLVFDPAGKNRHVYATGIRNCSGLTVAHATGEVWCSTNERDKLGDDLVPDYVTRVKEHGFYGWPWYYLGDNEDPRHAGKRRDLLGKITPPDVLLQPHSAPLQLAFYDGTMFPADYRGNLFVALHGSWNRGNRTGYKVVRVSVRGGAPTGEYEDFMTGFVVDSSSVWARPVGIAVGADGALYVGEDGNGTIWRVTYSAN